MKYQRIVAIFDVDGTLIAGATLERIFIGFLRRRGEFGWREMISWLGAAAKAAATGSLRLKAIKAYLRGKDSTHLRRLARECVERDIEPRLSPEAVNRLRWHQSAGHLVILLSGTLDLLLEPLAERLGVYARVGSELEIENMRFTGRIAGARPFGLTKAECLATINRANRFNLKRSFAYADSFADRHLLAMVGHPVATNADMALRKVAESRGWMIEEFA
ncbi:MAG TPA: HAD-IB family hydrolase [Blastocatellia bacterium]|jgi:HAD superfamily hydrolase (TIGR01490 family)|nr:HAD-IB family hydrolase [Blastocatellia bacterium]